MFITDALALAYVPRWAIVRHASTQSVAEHSFNVAMIAAELIHRLKLQVDSAAVIKLALVHDLDECVTGDIPTPAKALLGMKPGLSPLVPVPPHHPMAPQIHPDESNLIKLADLIECHTWIAMNGLGQLAKEATEYLYGKLMAHVETHRYDAGAVSQLVQDIIREQDRLRR